VQNRERGLGVSEILARHQQVLKLQITIEAESSLDVDKHKNEVKRKKCIVLFSSQKDSSTGPR